LLRGGLHQIVEVLRVAREREHLSIDEREDLGAKLRCGASGSGALACGGRALTAGFRGADQAELLVGHTHPSSEC
jgi:hypothetical protein